MKSWRNRTGYRFFFIAVCILCLSIKNVLIASDALDQINHAIASSGAQWTAGENWVTRLSPEEQARLFGGRIPDINRSKLGLIPVPPQPLPDSFDWRDNNGNWMTPVRDQGWSTQDLTFVCGCCWDFAAIGAIEAWWKIHNNEPDAEIDLSEQYVLSCGPFTCWSGGSAEYVFEMAQKQGIPSETCFPYLADDTVPCINGCPGWENDAVKIPGYGYISFNEVNVENIKTALMRRPVIGYMVVYEDFPYYQNGVYEHLWGDQIYGHCIVITGWNDADQSWTCKNSFGTSWGEDGYFRIKWGDCLIGQYCVMIWDNLAGGPAIAIRPEHLEYTLTAGDSLSDTFTIRNLSTEPLEYSTLTSGNKSYFHPDIFNAWDGRSWWCGDPAIGGYGDFWLQFLDSPVLDLTGTGRPELTFKGYWALEDTAGMSGYMNYDGWDGCNVWISTDNGRHFAIVESAVPAYDARDLFSFGAVWDEGKDIPGWVGSSGGWQDITCNLSSFQSDSVIIRFALASDWSESAVNNSRLSGFFVDDICVCDGSTVLFEDTGDDLSQMLPSGENIIEAEWVQVKGASGMLLGLDSTEAQISIGPEGLEPGKYRGRLIVLSNDTSKFIKAVPIDITVLKPDHDIQLSRAGFPAESLPILSCLCPAADIKNQGRNTETDIQINCRIQFEGEEIYSDSYTVGSLSEGAEAHVLFKPLALADPGEVVVYTWLSNRPDDHNRFNNELTSSAAASNLIDDFETVTGFWQCEEGWTVETQTRHTGFRSIHTVEEASLNCCMIFAPGFNFTETDHATLRFWARFDTEADIDILTIEASRDSLTWITLDSLSGRQWSRWLQYHISLNDFTGSGNENVHIRFHYVSDAENIKRGVYLDDITIHTDDITMVDADPAQTVQPRVWALSANHPNPFNPSTVIEYSLAEAAQVRLIIYDILGRKVKTLTDLHQPAGTYQTVWDGTGGRNESAAAGVYLCRMETAEFTKVLKLVLVR